MDRPKSHPEDFFGRLNRTSFMNGSRGQTAFEGLDLWFKQQLERTQNNPYLFPSRNYTNQIYMTDFKLPHFDPPKVNWDDLVPKRSASSTIWISSSSVLFLIFMVLRLCLYCQRCQSADHSVQRRLSLEQQLAAGRHNDPPQNGDTDSVTLSVTSEISSHSNSDLPPAYSEITASNNGFVNKNIDLASEELPPPYSVCLKVMGNTEEMIKVHKSPSVAEEPQTHSNTDSLQNNSTDTSHRIDVGQNNVDISALWVRFDNDRIGETTIDIDERTANPDN